MPYSPEKAVSRNEFPQLTPEERIELIRSRLKADSMLFDIVITTWGELHIRNCARISDRQVDCSQFCASVQPVLQLLADPNFSRSSDIRAVYSNNGSLDY
jgi:hypothetical protein